MKIYASLYLKKCEEALIQLTNTEKIVLERVTDDDGWADRIEYLKELEKTTAIYVTKNQRQILKWLPTKEDDPFSASTKNIKLKEMIRDIRTQNLK